MPISPAFTRVSCVAAAMLVALVCGAAVDWYRAKPAAAIRTATYVGRHKCAQCHQPEMQAWSGSHHDRAMEVASEETVDGDFDNAEFNYFGVQTRFFREGDRFMVNTIGPDGEYHDYEIKYTFGLEPLQQYMVEFPDGRVQVLRVSWDQRRQEWFFVAPPDAEEMAFDPDDPLHWTGLSQNWNTMCAECHST
ncbi:MAG: multiheme c-type cytochrome, partial [Planctomycetota bacterium]